MLKLYFIKKKKKKKKISSLLLRTNIHALLSKFKYQLKKSICLEKQKQNNYNNNAIN